jgi:hypothetical protein
MEYEHTQYGYTGLLTAALVGVMLLGSFQSAFEESVWVGLLMSLFFASLVALTFWFGKLVVEVNNGNATAAFGLGKPRRSIPLIDVVDVRVVRNNWFQGWGVRKVSNGWMYNVWGLSAVQIELESGDVFLIGTDEPEKLRTAIILSLPG